MHQKGFCLSFEIIKQKSDKGHFYITVCEGHICHISSTKSRWDNDTETALHVARTTWQKAVKSILFYTQHTFNSLHIVVTLHHNSYRHPIGFYGVNKIPQAEVMALFEYQL